MVLRIGFVREHFSSPLLQYAAADKEKTFTLVECPSGTGQLIAALTDNVIDVAIALTDPLIAGIAKGSTAYKLVGSYVKTPLNWAVITGVNSKFQSIDDLKGTTIGISRPGSGSQTMAFVTALQQNWPTGDLTFKVNNDIHGLIASVNDGSTSAFMWEWFTTKPWVDRGEARFIGSVPTPWPSWMIAAHPSQDRAPTEALKDFLNELSGYVRNFDSEESRAQKNVDFIKEAFGYPEEDIKAWLKTVGYPGDCLVVSKEVIDKTLNVLIQAGAIQSPPDGFKAGNFVNEEVGRLE